MRSHEWKRDENNLELVDIQQNTLISRAPDGVEMDDNDVWVWWEAFKINDRFWAWYCLHIKLK